MEEKMRPFKMIFAVLVLVLALLGQSQSASAGPATHYSVRPDNVTIPWAYPPPEGLSSFCSQIPEGVHINPDDFGSDRVKNLNVNEMEDGTKHILWTDLIKGTASDDSGTSYRFLYENNTTFGFDGSTVTVDMKDTFKLKGGDVNYTVGFHWRWQYLADHLDVVQIPDGNGQIIDLFVDPFIANTTDGLTPNPDPNFVQGSWQILNNRGDPNPLSCDPL
jgi:hypothetical protein